MQSSMVPTTKTTLDSTNVSFVVLPNLNKVEVEVRQPSKGGWGGGESVDKKMKCPSPTGYVVVLNRQVNINFT